MDGKVWKLAKLSDKQLNEIRQAEPVIGKVNLLAFEPVDLNLAPLAENQVAHIKSLEKSSGLTIVAYKAS